MESLPLSLYDPRKEEENYKSKFADLQVKQDERQYLHTANLYEESMSRIGLLQKPLLLALRKIMRPGKIAEALDISRSHLANLTHGRTPISPRIYVLLAKLYSKKLEELKNAK